MGHARAIAAAPDPESLAREIVARGLSVRQAEKRARNGPSGARASSCWANRARSIPTLRRSSDSSATCSACRSQVAHKAEGGTVSLHYSSLEQLDMICQRLTGEPI